MAREDTMSDSEIDTNSSSGSDVSQRISLQPRDEPAIAAINYNTRGDRQAPGDNPPVDDAASDISSATSSIKNSQGQSLHLEWQTEEKPQGHHGDEENSADAAQEPRLIDFVVVPGVYGNWNDGVGKCPGSGSSAWVLKFAGKPPESELDLRNPRSNCRVLRFEYDSSQIFCGRRSRQAIHQIALKLLCALRSRRQAETKKRLIYFITHDLGGIIVKDALVTASLERNAWMDISEMTRVLVFNGCPHRSFHPIDLRDRLTRFIFENYDSKNGKFRPSAPSIPGVSDAINQINGLFVESKIPLRSWIITLYSGRLQQSGIHNAFDDFSGTLGLPLEKRIEDPGESDYWPLTEYLKKLELDIRQPIDPTQYRYERTLLSLASPVYPLRNERRFNPLDNLPEYRDWLRGPGPQILYINGDCTVQNIAEQVFYSLEGQAEKFRRRAMVLYFSFDRKDVRCDSIRDMIGTFLAQIANHYPKLTTSINLLFRQLYNDRGWTEQDLVQFFDRFRSSEEVEQTMIVINHFDHCTKGSRRRFLDDIVSKYENDEAPWKIVVTSHEPGALTEELSGPFCVPIDLSATELGVQASDEIEDELARLSQIRPDMIYQEEKVREELRFIHNLEPPMRQIIYEQSKIRSEWPDEASVHEIFGSLYLGTTGIKDENALERVLDWVLKGFPDQVMLRRLLPWLLYAVRPLTIWELATVLTLGTDHDRGNISPSLSVVESTIAKIQKGLAGIVEVDHNEVKLQHPRLHSIMLISGTFKTSFAGKRYIWDEIRDTAHHDIADLCLQYLSKAAVQEYIDEILQVTNPSTFKTPTFLDRTNLVSYAVQAWTHHYSLSSPSLDLSWMASQSCLAQTLARAYWALANPITKSVTCLETLFPIFAGLGVDDAVKPRDDLDAFYGLLEAGRKGQDKTVRELLDEYKFSESQLWEALEAITSSGNEDMMLSFLEYVTLKLENTADIQWPPVLIYRASWLNLYRFAETVLDLGCSPDPDVEYKVTMQASPLLMATRNGHIETIRVLLKYGANLNFVGRYERNPLHVAAVEGHPDAVRIFMEEGKLDIDCTCDNNFTALYLAALFGHHRTVEQLLNMGADPNMGISSESRADEQWSPLIVASEDGFERCVELLLDKKANPNIYGPMGPPLVWAVGNGHLKICDLLLAAGADPKSELIKTPLLATAVGSKFEHAGLPMLERLLELDLDVNAKHADGTSILIHAARCYPKETMNGTTSYGLSPQRDIAVQRLLERGADPNLSNEAGITPLLCATLTQQYKLAKILLEKGADPDQKSKQGMTPLFSAVRGPEITHLLLDKGANPNLGVTGGWTNLTKAALFGYTETVRILLDHGASVDLAYGESVENVGTPEFQGWTPLMFAASGGHPNIVHILAEAGANMQHTAVELNRPVIHEAIFGQSLPAFLEYAARVDVNQVDSEDWTGIHFSSIPFDNLKRLVNAGANIEAVNDEGDTALTVAACVDVERTKYLVDKGANINHVSPWYGAALHQACRKPDFETIKLLMKKGADINQVCDGPYGSPLQALCLRHDIDIAPSLIEEMVRYLLDEDKENPHMRPKERRADVALKAGLLGFAINAAALADTPNIISLILDQEHAAVNVKDDVGRAPIHFAALNGIQNFEAILDRGADIYTKDKLGRTALHWAAQGGRLQVVERIISLLDDKTNVEVPDIDGWTPLCWAARGPASWLKENRASEPSAQADTIKRLIENGADRDVATSIGDEEWTPVTIGHYHRCSSEVLSILKAGRTASNPTASDGTNEEPSRANTGQQESYKHGPKLKMGIWQDGPTCDGCQCAIVGIFYVCKLCSWMCFCFKCYAHVDLLHSPGHEYEKKGSEEYVEDKEENKSIASSSSSSQDSDTDSDT